MTLNKNNRRGQFPSIFDDRFMRDLFHNDWNPATSKTVPAVNIQESNESYLLAFAVPGMKKEDFKIELNNDQLIVSAKVEEGKEETVKYTRKEFNFTSFERRFTLPETANVHEIGAKYENGVLNVTVPKKEEAKVPAPKHIEIA